MEHLPTSRKHARITWKTPLLLAALAMATVACGEQRGNPPLPQATPKPMVHMPAIDDDDAPDGEVVTVPFIVPSRPMRPPPGLI